MYNLVENTGIEPVVPEGGGFTVHCITIDASSPLYSKALWYWFSSDQENLRMYWPCFLQSTLL